MKKKLDTRFPAARIKKIMQSDEDVGKIAMAVPLLVSKALELFLQDLCDRTYGITLERGAKTVSSFHLKQCVQSFNVFDFLKDVVRKVPDLGGASAGGDEHALGKRRKVENEDHNVDEALAGRILKVGYGFSSESLESGISSATTSLSFGTGHPSVNTSNNGRGCARGRGRGRPRGRPRASESRAPARPAKYEDDPDLTEPMDTNRKSATTFRNFDLNIGLDDNGDSSTNIISPEATMVKEPPGWQLGEDDMAVDPVQLASLNRAIDEDDDYDDEG